MIYTKFSPPPSRRCATICDKLSQLGILESRTKQENPYVIDESLSTTEDFETVVVAAAARNGGGFPDTPPPPLPFPRGSSIEVPNRQANNGGGRGFARGLAAPTQLASSSERDPRPLPTPPVENVYEEVSDLMAGRAHLLPRLAKIDLRVSNS